MMSLENMPVGKRPEFNITSTSTLFHLIAVALTCAVLWSVIVATVNV